LQIPPGPIAATLVRHDRRRTDDLAQRDQQAFQPGDVIGERIEALVDVAEGFNIDLAFRVEHSLGHADALVERREPRAKRQERFQGLRVIGPARRYPKAVSRANMSS
jgi:hypothetical protein